MYRVQKGVLAAFGLWLLLGLAAQADIVNDPPPPPPPPTEVQTSGIPSWIGLPALLAGVGVAFWLLQNQRTAAMQQARQ